MTPRRCPRTAAGFTLLELLVAMGIFAILAVMAYGGLSGMLTTRAQADEHAEALRGLQLAYRTLERDIEQWVPREVRDEFGQSAPALTAGNEIGAALELTHGGWRNPAEQTRSTLQRVAYSVQDDTLVRSLWLSLDRPADAKPVEQELLDGVTELQLRFLDGSDVWQERWPPPGQSAPPEGAPVPPGAVILAPRALEMILVTERWGELRWLFRFPE
ncbi:MAG TPA: type II secretion system minor pseudopilin GspJ [Gammaproteobacteria bacterium]